MNRIALRGWMALLSFVLVGCGSSDSATPTKAQGGTAVGRVLGEDGKPISIAGAKIDVSVWGNSSAGEKLSYSPTVAADGSWKTKLADGVYHAPKGTIHVPWKGKIFDYELVPTKDQGDFEAKDGCAVDFVWHVTGPQPTYATNADPANWTNWFGASASVLLDQYADGPQTPTFGDAKTKVVFTVTPTGPAIDGKTGAPRVFTLGEIDPQWGPKVSALHDLPVGSYHVTGKRIAGDGTETPLKLRIGATPYADSVDFDVGIYAGYSQGQAIGPFINFAAK